jgi:hypothetical protein
MAFTAVGLAHLGEFVTNVISMFGQRYSENKATATTVSWWYTPIVWQGP